MSAAVNYSEFFVFHNHFDEALWCLVGNLIAIDVEKLKETTLISVLVDVKVPIIDKHVCNRLSTHVVDEVWFKLYINSLREFCLSQRLAHILLMLFRFKIVNSS
jgi:hypothetical protein